MRRAVRAVPVVVAGLALMGCPALLGIDHEYGVAPEGNGAPIVGGAADGGNGSGDTGAGGAGPEAGTSDQLSPSPADAPTASDASSSQNDAELSPDSAACGVCSLPTPAGWSPILFETSRDSPCPTGFMATDLVENPVANAATCTCGACAVTAQADCDQGSVATYGGCAGATGALATTGGACVATLVGVGPSEAATAPPALGGTCSAATSADDSTVSVTSERVCAPVAACAPCAAQPRPGWMTCLMAAGVQSCPAGAAAQHVLGVSPVVNCSTCGCTLASTCGGTLNIYLDVGCSELAVAIPATGACVNTSFSHGLAANAYQWVGSVASAQCTSGTSTASITLQSQVTVCCP